MRTTLFPAWERYRESRDVPEVCPGMCLVARVMPCAGINSLGSMPIKCHGADASRDPADSLGKTRLLFDSLFPRGLPRNDLSWPELCSKQDI